MANLSACDAWLATQNRNGSPHLAPIRFAAKRANSMWTATARHSTKVSNISKDSEVSIGVPAEGDPNGDALAIGTAALHDEAPTDVLEMFNAKYQWYSRPRPDPDVSELLFIEITPHRWVMGSFTTNK